jgi:DNA-binding GntR family transcriptional regulator
VACAREHATRLKLKAGEPLLRIHRTTFDAGGRAVDYQQLHCRGDAYRFHCEMNLLRHTPDWRGEFAR